MTTSTSRSSTVRTALLVLGSVGLALEPVLLGIVRPPRLVHLEGGLTPVLLATVTWIVWGTLRWAAAGALILAALRRAAPRADPGRVGAGLVLALAVAWLGAGLRPPLVLLLGHATAMAAGALLVEVGGFRPHLRRALVVTLVVMVLLLIGAGLRLLSLVAEPQRALPRRPAVPSAEKRRLYRLVMAANPRWLPAGETRQLRLSTRDLNLLLDWGLATIGASASGTLATGHGRLSVELSLPLPAGRHLNLSGGMHASHPGTGRWRLEAEDVRLGRLHVPALVSKAASMLALDALGSDARMRIALDAVREVHIDGGGLTATYTHADIPKELVGALVRGEASGELAPVVRDYARHLIGGLREAPAPESLAAYCVRHVFRRAAERSPDGDPVAENRAALVALGILLGHWKVETLVGEVLTPADRHRVRGPLRQVPLRGRADWTRHFFVSAALTALSAQAVADEAGLFKEELDADGGSGFSFADLLADRAGTRFAALALSDAAQARALQETLAHAATLEDFLPEASGLPEGIPDVELQAAYGGVNGAGYRRYIGEIDLRMAALPSVSPRPR